MPASRGAATAAPWAQAEFPQRILRFGRNTKDYVGPAVILHRLHTHVVEAPDRGQLYLEFIVVPEPKTRPWGTP